MLRALFLDFDGVVLDTVQVKSDAFVALFAEYPEHAEAIRQYHLDHAGRPRRAKFRYFYETLLQRSYTPTIDADLCARFSRIVFEQVVQAAYMPGAQAFLDQYHDRVAMHVVSATPEEELRRIVTARDMAHYFHGVFGSPRSKADIITDLLTQYATPPDQTLFVGDALADWHAAQEAKVPFIGLVADATSSLHETSVERVTSLRALPTHYTFPAPHAASAV